MVSFRSCATNQTLDGQGVFFRLYAPFHGQRRGHDGSLPNDSDGFGAGHPTSIRHMHGGLPHGANMPGWIEKGRWGGQVNAGLFVCAVLRVKQVRTDSPVERPGWRNGPCLVSQHVSRYQTNQYLIVPFQLWGVGAFCVVWGNVQEADGRNAERQVRTCLSTIVSQAQHFFPGNRVSQTFPPKSSSSIEQPGLSSTHTTHLTDSAVFSLYTITILPTQRIRQPN